MASSWLWPNSLVTRVIDGDSLEATVTHVALEDIGFRQTQRVSTSFPVKLRLNRINAKPIKTAEGVNARNFVLDRVIGILVSIETLKTYKFGGGETPEWMAEITLPDGTNLSDSLVSAGLAVYWDGTGPRPD